MGKGDKKKITKKITQNKKTSDEPEKLNIIFDIDSTLIHSFSARNNKINLMSVLPNTEYYTGKLAYLFYIRRYAHFLLRYCLEHFNVGIWSTGTTKYIDEILHYLFPADLYNKLNVIITRDKQTDKEIICKDTKNNKTFRLTKFNGNSIKYLDYLFNDKFYSKTFNKKNTLLIDDLAANISVNPLNSVFIPAYCYKKQDNILFELYLWLDSIKNTKNIQTKSKSFHKYDKNVKSVCVLKQSTYKVRKLKKYNVGDWVSLKIKENFFVGYIIKINKDKTYTILEFDEEFPQKNNKLKQFNNIKQDQLKLVYI